MILNTGFLISVDRGEDAAHDFLATALPSIPLHTTQHELLCQSEGRIFVFEVVLDGLPLPPYGLAVVTGRIFVFEVVLDGWRRGGVSLCDGFRRGGDAVGLALCRSCVYAWFGMMHEPEAMHENRSPAAARLAGIAVGGRLVVYAGAGISTADPTCLPGGAEIAELCHRRLSDELGSAVLGAADASDLVSVADAVADGGTSEDVDHVRRTAVGVAGFTTAAPNFGHEVLALLMLEGFVDVITANWDDCIERAGGEERILAVKSDQDRAQITQRALLKVHGCATRPSGILMTSEDLSDPPAWARDAVNDRLASCSVVFVGIGDVAQYVRERVEEAVERVGSRGDVYVVGPDVVTCWEDTRWAGILPDLPEARRVEASADVFLDQLAGACIRRNLGDRSERLADAEAERNAFDAFRSAFERRTSLEGLRWLRRCAFSRSPGRSVVQEQAFTIAVIALGKLGRTAAGNGRSGLEIPPVRSSGRVGARAVIGRGAYEVLVAVGTVTNPKFRREAARRLQRLRSEGCDPSDDPVFLLAGALAVGGSGAVDDGSTLLVADLIADSGEADLVAGPLVVEPELVYAEDCIRYESDRIRDEPDTKGD